MISFVRRNPSERGTYPRHRAAGKAGPGRDGGPVGWGDLEPREQGVGGVLKPHSSLRCRKGQGTEGLLRLRGRKNQVAKASCGKGPWRGTSGGGPLTLLT